MIVARDRLAFATFHVLLVAVLLATGLPTLWHAALELDDPGHAHLALVAGLRVLGAVLLLFSRTAWFGVAALLLVLLPGFVFEALHGDWQPESLVYASGAWLVAAHDSARGTAPAGPAAAGG